MKLSICIPTFNRAELLRECLASVIPQAHNKAEVEVIVIDNASPDHTRSVVNKFQGESTSLRYYRNELNLGYSGNQVKCFEYAAGEYMAILCDDDLYTPGLVSELLKVICNSEYAFIALNYFSFVNDVTKPYKSDYAPEKDVIFKRAYDIMNYPTVGHYSGFVFNIRIAKNTLDAILSEDSYQSYEKYRGLLNIVATTSTANSTLPSYFVGKRLLAARRPPTVDYDAIHHICLDYYEIYLAFFKKGIITDKDLDHRADEVIGNLTRAIVIDTPKLDQAEIKELTDKFYRYFSHKIKFMLISYPLLLLAHLCIVRKGFLCIYKIVKHYKHVKYCNFFGSILRGHK